MTTSTTSLMLIRRIAAITYVKQVATTTARPRVGVVSGFRRTILPAFITCSFSHSFSTAAAVSSSASSSPETEASEETNGNGGLPPPSPPSPPSRPRPPPPPPRPSLPTRHSRHNLPLVCVDPVQCHELTQQVLESDNGSLFAKLYDGKLHSQKDAWTLADPTCQTVEFLLRGYAHLIPGTQWNRWLRTAGKNRRSASRQYDNDEAALLETMTALLDRLEQEGYVYMQLRADRLEELKRRSEHPDSIVGGGGSNKVEVEKLLRASDELDLEALGRDNDDGTIGLVTAGAMDATDVDEDEDDPEVELFESVDAPQEFGLDYGEAGSGSKFLNDFALPGPTVHMYDTLLDAMACSLLVRPGAISGNDADYDDDVAATAVSSLFIFPEEVYDLLGDIVGRHQLDGGDASNINPHTRPTLQSFNAAIRIAANLPYNADAAAADADGHDDSTESSSLFQHELRDNAMILAFGAFDALSQSTILERNCATYAFLLQVLAKYVPPSVSRGNMARGMWQHALLQGIIDETVMAAMLAANVPSNGPAHDEFVQRCIAGKVLKELPHKWRRYSRVRRFHAREATY